MRMTLARGILRVKDHESVCIGVVASDLTDGHLDVKLTLVNAYINSPVYIRVAIITIPSEK